MTQSVKKIFFDNIFVPWIQKGDKLIQDISEYKNNK